AVTGRSQMNAMEELLHDVIVDAGVNRACIYRRRAVELPGYFRAEKKWDLLVVIDGKLVAAVEFKSQVGPSFGNNFNNRTEEAIGSAIDLWTAFREGRLSDFRPWLGYFFLLEECEGSVTPVRNQEPHFQVDEAFRSASYLERYRVFCRRLVLERV